MPYLWDHEKLQNAEVGDIRTTCGPRRWMGLDCSHTWSIILYAFDFLLHCDCVHEDALEGQCQFMHWMSNIMLHRDVHVPYACSLGLVRKVQSKLGLVCSFNSFHLEVCWTLLLQWDAL